MVITRWADRVGRRRLLIWSVFGYMSFSGLTALAPNAQWFTTFQFLQQLFLVAEGAIVWTMAAEELPADSRVRLRRAGDEHCAGHGVCSDPVGLVSSSRAACRGGGCSSCQSRRSCWSRSCADGREPALVARGSGPARRALACHPRPDRAAVVDPGRGHDVSHAAHPAGEHVHDRLPRDRPRPVVRDRRQLHARVRRAAGHSDHGVGGALSDRYGRRLVGCTFAFASVVGASGSSGYPAASRCCCRSCR